MLTKTKHLVLFAIRKKHRRQKRGSDMQQSLRWSVFNISESAFGAPENLNKILGLMDLSLFLYPEKKDSISRYRQFTQTGRPRSPKVNLMVLFPDYQKYPIPGNLLSRRIFKNLKQTSKAVLQYS